MKVPIDFFDFKKRPSVKTKENDMYIPPKIKKLLLEFDFTDWLNIPLTKQHTDLLCKELNLPGYSYKPCSWSTLKRYLEGLDFDIKYAKRLINGKQTRVYILKKEQP